ncbi:hypothetical protein [Haloarcula amylolytica]|uniref:Glycosyltransferase RgtA/B/C/D-like domain-containing protein n=1 Tax=Haloarcula amylolytica JCM 13557 TaxID=1227452 RepID=M0K709_9EURY|nr:hypothetical protein [Haloarcula amylolytica]EMA15944.1 hypothetical protein C442_18419 [Haloarcula amylolytica JCM 13557]
MNRTLRINWQPILVALPALLFVPLLDTLIPMHFHKSREIAGYFQSLAFSRMPINSFFILTPSESYSALHLHSTLASPLVALGYHEGGRLISLLSILVASIVIFKFVSYLADYRAGLLAAGFFWLFPLTQRFAYAYLPESLSIVLTTAALFLAYIDAEQERELYFYASIILLLLAITNHLWEAVILAPIGAIYWATQKRRKFATFAAIGVTWTGVIHLLTKLQPSNTSQLTNFGTQTNGALFLQINWWLTYLPSNNWYLSDSLTTFQIFMNVVLPLTVASTIGWGIYYLRSKSNRALMLSAWHFSGIVIPLALVGGYHLEYFMWGTLAPLAVSSGLVLHKVLDTALESSYADTKTVVLVYLLLVSASGAQVWHNEYGPLDDETPPQASLDGVAEYEGYAAGRQMAGHQMTPKDITFVGPEFVDGSYNNYAHDHGRVVVYSDLLLKERSRVATDGGPTYVNETSMVDDCVFLVERVNDELFVRRCN